MEDLVDRRDFVRSYGIGAASFILTGCKHTTPRRRAIRPELPNIVFVMSDDHAAQAISCYGSKINETPSIDHFAQASAKGRILYRRDR